MNNRKIAGVFVFFLSMLLSIPAAVLADFNSGSTGADGALAPPSSPNSYIVPAQGHDDGVYNFTTVTIPAGVTVTFQKNANNTPITIKASGDVMINGTISVNGGAGTLYQPAGIGGPGGFDGGIGGWFNSNGYRGFGPGGGDGSAAGGYGGTFTYGNDGQIPMIGGSGGGGAAGKASYTGGSGGGGGGAILIASSGTITVNGSITANGGSGSNGVWYTVWPNSYWGSAGGGGGSGGAIRLIATTIAGNGTISATGAGGGSGTNAATSGGVGRIRLEAWDFTRTAQTSPPSNTNTLKWNPTAIAPSTLPTLAITSVGGATVPAIPKGDSKTPDIQLPANITNPVAVIISSSNIPSGTTVTVKSLSSIGTTVQTASATLGGTNDPLTATVNVDLVIGYSTVLTVSATFTAVASNGSPLYAEGERVDKIRVDSAIGGIPTITYIMASGREIPKQS